MVCNFPTFTFVTSYFSIIFDHHLIYLLSTRGLKHNDIYLKDNPFRIPYSLSVGQNTNIHYLLTNFKISNTVDKVIIPSLFFKKNGVQ